MRKIDTEVELHSAHERNRRMSVADVSFDTDSTPEETSKEDPSSSSHTSATNLAKIHPESNVEEIVEVPANTGKQLENNELLYLPSPYSELMPPPLEEKKDMGPKKSFKFLFGANSIPRRGSRGEDAYFVTSRALGVADGVSGWCQYGIDCSEFSKELMKGCEKSIGSQLKNSTLLDPLLALTEAYEKVTAPGSSTATIATINGSTLNGLNLGDSGFVCFTKKCGEYVSHGVSKEKQHNFNTPYQLSRFPSERKIAELRKRVPEDDIKQLLQTIERNDLCKDPPSSADRYIMQLHEGDIVVLGTDGLFDNLFKDEIKKIVREVVKGVTFFDDKIAKELADKLVFKTYERSKSSEVKTPFQVKYKRELNASWTKGKEDDITVVVGIVKAEL